MKSARRILLSKFSKTHHSRRICYSAAAAAEAVEVVKAESLDDLDFPEYDPTPYGGGYDLAATYGQPLPPSADICYPPSPYDPDSSTLKEFSYGSLPSPYGNGGADHGPHMSSSSRGVAEPSTDVEKQPSQTQNGNEGADRGHPESSSKGGVAEPSAGIEKQPSQTQNGNSHTKGFEDADIISHGGPEHEEEESYAWGNSTSSPGECCQSSFFSWVFPFEEDENCYRRRDDDEEGWNGGQWKGAEEYLFGFSYPGSERKDLEIYSCAKKNTHEQSSWLHEATAYYQNHQEKESNLSNSRISDIVPTYYEDYQEEEYPQSNSVPNFNGNYQEKMSTDIVPTYYEDYQEDEYPQSKCAIANSVPIYNEGCPEKQEHSRSNGIGTAIVPFYYEDYQEEEYHQSKYVITNSLPIYNEDDQKKQEHSQSNGNGTEIVPFYYEDYEEEEEFAWAKDVTTDVVQASYYEDYQEEEYLRSKYVTSKSVLPTYDEGYGESYTQSRGTGTQIVPIYYEDYQEEDVITDIAPTYYGDYQEEYV